MSFVYHAEVIILFSIGLEVYSSTQLTSESDVITKKSGTLDDL